MTGFGVAAGLNILLHLGDDGRIFRQRSNFLRFHGCQNTADRLVYFAAGGPAILSAKKHVTGLFVLPHSTGRAGVASRFHGMRLHRQRE